MKQKLLVSIALAAFILPVGFAASPTAPVLRAGFAQNEFPTQDQLTQFVQDQLASNKLSKDDADLCLAVIQRHFTDPNSMKASEVDLFNAMVTEYPHYVKAKEAKAAGIITRDPHNNPMADLLGGGGGGGSTSKPAPRKPAHGTPAKPKPLAARHNASFSSGTHKSGGKSVGYVSLNVDGRSTTLVEVNSSSGGMSMGARARSIRDRFVKLNNADRLWWMKLSVGVYAKNGEVIVKSPHAEKGIVITADKDYAKSRGMDPKGLAQDLISKIRNGFEPGG